MGTPSTISVDSTVRFLGAHAETLATLARLRLLALTATTVTLEQQARLGKDIVQLIDHQLKDHHRDEEQLLFPAMQLRASQGDETRLVNAMTARLTREHRALEALWAQIRPALQTLEAGTAANLPVDHCLELAHRYGQHTQFEETVVLPLAARLLSDADKGLMELSMTLRHNLRNLTQYI